jgi:hypothetical protein
VEAQLKKNKFILKIVLTLIFFVSLGGETMVIEKETQDVVRRFLLVKHGETSKLRIDKGLQQVAAFWRPEDGSVET